MLRTPMPVFLILKGPDLAPKMYPKGILAYKKPLIT